jgi:hypothetical protein
MAGMEPGRNYLQGIRNNIIGDDDLRRILGEPLVGRYINELSYWRALMPNQTMYSRRAVTGMRTPMTNPNGTPRMKHSDLVETMINLNPREIREYFRLKDKYQRIYSEEKGALSDGYLFNLMQRFLKFKREYFEVKQLRLANINLTQNGNRQDEKLLLGMNNSMPRLNGNRAREAENNANGMVENAAAVGANGNGAGAGAAAAAAAAPNTTGVRTTRRPRTGEMPGGAKKKKTTTKSKKTKTTKSKSKKTKKTTKK